MATVYSYYNAQKHQWFEMGKWGAPWGLEDGDAVAKLFLPQAELEKAILEVGGLWVGRLGAEYARWLAEQLIDFRGDAPIESFRWVNDYDDSNDVCETAELVGTRYRGADGNMEFSVADDDWN